jgi:hypothetical protein
MLPAALMIKGFAASLPAALPSLPAALPAIHFKI